jgi:c-di-GMP-binding flagellar brake protein YcgR
MDEKRRAPRLKDFSEITATVISRGNNLSKEKIFYNYSEDISVSGAKIRGNIPLPVDTLLKIDLTLNNLRQKITALGKVKWTKRILDDKWYEVGLEFFDTPSEVIKKLDDHIFEKQKFTSFNLFGLPFKNYDN